MSDSKQTIPDEWDDDDWEMTEEQLAYFKAKLVGIREEVVARLSRHVTDVTTDDDYSADELDQARKLSDQAYLMRIADKDQKLLKQIDRALGKFAEDEYGYCEGTGELIASRRLDLRPWTRYCIAYKEELERTRGKRR